MAKSFKPTTRRVIFISPSDEPIEVGENEAENRELVIWLNGYMDPYEGQIDTSRYSGAEVVQTVFP